MPHSIANTAVNKQGSMLLQTCQCDAYVSAIAPFLYRLSSASSRAGSSSLIWPPKPDNSCEQCKLLLAKICEVSCGQARVRQRRDSIPQLGQSRPRLDKKSVCLIDHSLACCDCTCTGRKPQGLHTSQPSNSTLAHLFFTDALKEYDLVMVSALHGVLLEW